ncbi:hypothetical protein NFI96_010653, partial [Prochilodus magdalenae]
GAPAFSCALQKGMPKLQGYSLGCAVMGLLQASLLVLVGVTLAEAQWPWWDRWRQNPSPVKHYPQSQGQAFWPPGSRTVSQDPAKLELNPFLKPVQAPVQFYPRAFSRKPAVSPVQTPVQDPVQIPMQRSEQNHGQLPALAPVQSPRDHSAQNPDHASVQDPVPTPVQKPLQQPVLSPLLPGPNQPVWNLAQTPVPAPAQSPVVTNGLQPAMAPVQGPVLNPPVPAQSPALAPVQDQIQDPLPPPAWNSALASNPNAMFVPVWDPAQDPHPVPHPLPVLMTGLNPPVWNLVHTPMPAPVPHQVLTNGLSPVFAQVQDPVWNPQPAPAQDPVLPSSLNPVPAVAPVHGSPPVHAQDLARPSSLNPVPVVAPVHGSPPVHAQDPALPSSLNQVPVHGSPPVHAQDLARPSSLNPVPVEAPVHGSPPVLAQDPALPSSLNPVPVVAPVHGSPPVHAQNPAQAGGLTPLLMPPQIPIYTPAQAPGWDPAHAPLVSPGFDPLQTQAKLPPEPLKKLTWQFPKVPERPQQPPVHFDLRQPTPANSVAAACGESVVHVEVKLDLFGTGRLVNPSFLTFGGCAAVGQDSAAHVLIFQSELQACGSVLTMTEDDLIYSFILRYSPEPLPGTPIIRSEGAMVRVECHYSRKHNVSSNALVPSWLPYASTEVAEEHLVFTLKLMTDDWRFERPSNQYFLGDLMNIEASLVQFNHIPLRVFVDSCVATAVPDVNVVPRYSFIENHGCLVDAKVTGSSSHFLQRTQGDKLQFQLEVFRFEQDNSSLIYITCSLRGSTVSHPTDADHKACSFTANGYVLTQLCLLLSLGFVLRVLYVWLLGLHFEAKVSLGPILVEEDADENDVMEFLLKYKNL